MKEGDEQVEGSSAPQLDDVMMVRGADCCPQVIDYPSDTLAVFSYRPARRLCVCLFASIIFSFHPRGAAHTERRACIVFSFPPALTFDCNARTGH